MGKEGVTWNDPTIILTIVGISITTVYTILTALIWHATHRNTEATREILEAQHRPYVGILGAELESETIGDVRIKATVSNVSSIPSRGIEIDFEVRLSGEIHESNLHGDRAQIILFPGGSIYPSLPFSKEMMPYISSDSGLEIAITVRYQGMTNKKYTTYSSYSYGIEQQRFSLTAGTFK
jgi:hypothetical protein